MKKALKHRGQWIECRDHFGVMHAHENVARRVCDILAALHVPYRRTSNMVYVFDFMEPK